jgi:hypothetical protein
MIDEAEKARAEQRVAIAKDALAWEKAGALKINDQYYLRSVATGTSFSFYDNFRREDANKQARDIVLGKCQVCALGSLLLAKAVRYNAVSVQDIADIRIDRLTDHFSVEQINQIEAAFEGHSYSSANGTYLDDEVCNESWKAKYPDPSKRFRAIMKNIIRNKGTFVP